MPRIDPPSSIMNSCRSPLALVSATKQSWPQTLVSRIEIEVLASEDQSDVAEGDLRAVGMPSNQFIGQDECPRWLVRVSEEQRPLSRMPWLVQEQSFVRGPDHSAHAVLVILAT